MLPTQGTPRPHGGGRDRRVVDDRLEDLEWLLDGGVRATEAVTRAGFPSFDAAYAAARRRGATDFARRLHHAAHPELSWAR